MKISILKEKIQNLISGHQKNSYPEDSLGYLDLTPESDTKNSEEYIRALHWAIKNKEVKNIALSGPYGSGKSSVIKTYLAKHPMIKSKALNISLATFSTPSKECQKKGDKSKDGLKDDNVNASNEWCLDDVDKNVIEEGILKQLFYKVGANKIPQSRYRKIKRHTCDRTFVVLLLLMMLAILIYFGIYPSRLSTFNEKLIANGSFYQLSIIQSYTTLISVGMLVVAIASNIVTYVISNFRFDNISLGDKANIKKDNDQDSILNKALDEIVYFFESTKYKYVFIEDFPENDYTKFDSDNDEYFLGPIVTFKNDDGKIEIIDGQQRLTTLMLLLRAFYSKFGNMKDQYAIKTSEDISTCIWKTNEFGQPDKNKLKIDSEVSTDDDKEEFLTILKTGIVDGTQKSKYARTYRFFQEKINEFLQEYPAYFAYLPTRILNNCILLPIEAESQDTALRIFSTLNDRGKPLSDTDIFKAQFYKHYSSLGKKDEFIRRWKDLEAVCDDIFAAPSGSPMTW